MSERIFIVDHNAAWLETLMKRFEKEGLEVLTSRTCSEANEVININASPHLFLINSNLPDGDALSLCKGIRRENRLKESHILIMKDAATSEDEYRKIGIADFATRPFTDEDIVKKCLLFLKYGSSKPPKKKIPINPGIIAILIVLLAVIGMAFLLIGANKLSGN